MKGPDVQYSIVVPCYQDAFVVERAYSELRRVLDGLGEPYELIFVDDGSADGTFAAIERLQRAWPEGVTGVRLLRNFGQHAAVCAGFAEARGRIIVTIDSDLETPAGEIPKLIQKLEEGFDVVSGWRRGRRRGLLRGFSSWLLSRFVGRASGATLRDYSSMFRAYRREVVELLEGFHESAKNLFALVAWLNVRIAEIPVEVRESPAKDRSRYSLYKLVRMALDVVTGYTVFPILAISLVGIFTSTVGFVAGLLLLGYRFLYGTGPSGTVSVLALLCFFVGIQLLAIGIMGEYMSRVYLQVRQRPFFIVKDSLRAKPRESA